MNPLAHYPFELTERIKIIINACYKIETQQFKESSCLNVVMLFVTQSLRAKNLWK